MTVTEDLFHEPGLTQITVWARGVLLNKDARDCVVALTEAARAEGKHVQAFENYVDLPDRVGVPVRAYARISTDPIESRYVYENENPNLVLVLEETLVKGVPITGGMPPGGVVVVNTKRKPEDILRFIEDSSNIGILATVDASGLSSAVVTLSGAEGATDASGIGKGIAAPMVGAATRVFGLVQMENLARVVENKEALWAGFNQVNIMEVPGK
ncbi:MAG: oxalate oxidoreductase subunit delta [Bacillota bacterium]